MDIDGKDKFDVHWQFMYRWNTTLHFTRLSAEEAEEIVESARSWDEQDTGQQTVDTAQ